MVDYHPYHTSYVSDASWHAQRTRDIDELMNVYDSLSPYRTGYGSDSSTPSDPPLHPAAHYPSQTIQPPLISVTGPDVLIAHPRPSSVEPANQTFQPDPSLAFNDLDLEALQELNQLLELEYPIPDESYVHPPMAVPDTTLVPAEPPAPAPVPAPRPTRQPSPKSSRPSRVRLRESSSKLMTTVAAASAALRHNLPACLACKKGKIKCRRSASSDRCVNCETHNKDCIPGDPKSKSNPPTVGSLERQIRDLYPKIQSLMRALNGGTAAFSGSLTLPDLDPKPCDCPADQTHRPGCRVADPAMLCMRAGLMELRSIDDDDGEGEGEDAEMGTGGSESDDRHSGSNMSMISLGMSSGAPMGVFQELSLRLGSPGNERAPHTSTSSIGLAGADYFTPGPAAHPEIRRIMIEQGKLPSFLVQKSVSPADCLKLFDLFMNHWNISAPVLDPRLHTAKYVLARCPLLFTVVLAIAARNYHKPFYPLLMKEAVQLAGEAFVGGWKSVEKVQAFILLATFPAPSRRHEEERTGMYLSGATRMAMDLDLNRPAESGFPNEMAEREHLNRIRTWLICHNLEVSSAAKTGKPSTVHEDATIVGSRTWWESSRFNMSYDIHLCAFTQICMIFHKYHRVFVSDSNAQAAYTTKDTLEIADESTKEIEDFRIYFEKLFSEGSNREDDRCVHHAHVRYTANYFRLVVYSHCYRQSSVQGIQPGDPILLYCIDAASQLVKALTGHHAHSMYFKFSAEGWFTFGAFAGAFMIKLLCPQAGPVIDAAQHHHLRALVAQLIDTYRSPQVSIDEQHTPYIYAQFLSRLLARADELNGTVDEIVPEVPKPAMDELFALPSLHTLAP